MPVLTHPTLPDVTVSVSDDQALAWVEQGWQPATVTKPRARRVATTRTKEK